ncbi:MAG: orotate phosphoribosyltransferase [Spirochaetales bacterium]|jgi:orotate phosphoribosyltransferase|nr:orotate phosphoribosyltransferase [Spirochaetales bacterium]
MENIEKKVAQQLLRVKAVKLNAENPFTWASGWKSPIYCDNRKLLTYPAERKMITEALVSVISDSFKDVDLIAGVATGAIAWGIMVAEALGKPFVYVRPKPKDHGTQSQVEGQIEPNQRIVVVEDLVSTGASSLSACDALRKAGGIVLGMVAIFSYNFPLSRREFEYKDVELHTLCQYDSLLEEAVAENYIDAEHVEVLKEWRINPSTWNGVGAAKEE